MAVATLPSAVPGLWQGPAWRWSGCKCGWLCSRADNRTTTSTTAAEKAVACSCGRVVGSLDALAPASERRARAVAAAALALAVQDALSEASQLPRSSPADCPYRRRGESAWLDVGICEWLRSACVCVRVWERGGQRYEGSTGKLVPVRSRQVMEQHQQYIRSLA